MDLTTIEKLLRKVYEQLLTQNELRRQQIKLQDEFNGLYAHKNGVRRADK